MSQTNHGPRGRAAWPLKREVSFLLIQAELASQVGLIQVLGRYERFSMNRAFSDEITALGGDPTDEIWVWLVTRGPHGPSFTWGQTRNEPPGYIWGLAPSRDRR